MHKFIFLFFSVCLFSVAMAEETANPLRKLGINFESRMKYSRFSRENQYKIETLIKHHGENESSWYDACLKFYITDPGSSTKYVSTDLELLLMGHQFYENESSKLIGQIGRCKLDNLFDSKLQFNSVFNGISMSYSYKDLEIKAAEFLVDSFQNKFATIAEVSYSNRLYCPIKINYIVSDWHHDSHSTISQISAIHSVENLWYPADFYIGFIKNHTTKELSNGFYAGLKFGGIQKAFDWVIDFNYQYCEKNCIPDFDYNGIGMGSGASIKITVALTDNFRIENKFTIGTKDRIEFSAIYKW